MSDVQKDSPGNCNKYLYGSSRIRSEAGCESLSIASKFTQIYIGKQRTQISKENTVVEDRVISEDKWAASTVLQANGICQHMYMMCYAAS